MKKLTRIVVPVLREQRIEAILSRVVVEVLRPILLTRPKISFLGNQGPSVSGKRVCLMRCGEKGEDTSSVGFGGVETDVWIDCFDGLHKTTSVVIQ